MEWLVWPTLIILGVGLRMAIRVNYGARGPQANDPVHAFLHIMSWVLICLGALPIIIGSMVSLVGLIIVMLIAATVVEAVAAGRAAQRRSMAAMLAMLLERGQSVPSTAVSDGLVMPGRIGRAMRGLLAALGEGQPLAAAIRRHPGALPEPAIAYAAAGRTLAAESAAMRELSRSDASELNAVWRTATDRAAYLAAILTVMGVILTFVFLKIVPEFEMIFVEFDLRLPPVSQAFFLATSTAGRLAAPLVGFVWMLLLLILVAAICSMFDVSLLRPLSNWLFPGRSIAHVLRILAVATDQRQELSTVAERLAYVYPSRPLRRRLRGFAALVAAGEDWREELRQAGLVSPAEAGLLKSAEQAGNLPWALRAIADRKDRRAATRLLTSIQILYPLVILLIGGLVGFFALAMFLPLVHLIEGLAW